MAALTCAAFVASLPCRRSDFLVSVNVFTCLDAGSATSALLTRYVRWKTAARGGGGQHFLCPRGATSKIFIKFYKKRQQMCGHFSNLPGHVQPWGHNHPPKISRNLKTARSCFKFSYVFYIMFPPPRFFKISFNILKLHVYFTYDPSNFFFNLMTKLSFLNFI